MTNFTRLKNRENELNAAKKKNNDRLFADIEAMIKWLTELKDLLNDHQVKSMLNINPIIEIIRVCMKLHLITANICKTTCKSGLSTF